jgi:hypothetical protein
MSATQDATTIGATDEDMHLHLDVMEAQLTEARELIDGLITAVREARSVAGDAR